jgi:precorrin-3B C17-methyltransferase
MSGKLYIIGLGPGADDLQAPRATMALSDATDIVGYQTYVARVPFRSDQIRHFSDNREEIRRACDALDLAAEGRRVAIISSGDPGVFAMASAVFEAVEHGNPAWRATEIEIIPGISAMFAAAARIGAPLGHDFCAISLSDNLKPWETVLARLRAVAVAGFVIALYNPQSVARPWQLAAAFDELRSLLPPTTYVTMATAISRCDEHIVITTLADVDPSQADMRTLILVGSAETRQILRPSGGAWLYTPRGARA